MIPPIKFPAVAPGNLELVQHHKTLIASRCVHFESEDRRHIYGLTRFRAVERDKICVPNRPQRSTRTSQRPWDRRPTTSKHAEMEKILRILPLDKLGRAGQTLLFKMATCTHAADLEPLSSEWHPHPRRVDTHLPVKPNHEVKVGKSMVVFFGC